MERIKVLSGNGLLFTASEQRATYTTQADIESIAVKIVTRWTRQQTQSKSG